jgi:glycosyltransferase involved in cell wall biosynthesis
MNRLLLASIHSYLDPSSGAALADRDLLELLAARGVDCRALTAGILDFEQDTPLGALIERLGLPLEPRAARLPGGDTSEVFDGTLNGVRMTLSPTASSRLPHAPTREEAVRFLDLADGVLDRFRPQVLLIYGAHPVNIELMRRARLRRIAVVFHLHNFAYGERSAFTRTDAILVPSHYAREYYRRTLGLETTAIPYPIRPERVVADDAEPRFITFVNPQPAKGVAVFAGIALELGKRRPDIPLMVVEGRGTTDWLAKIPLDLSELTNLHRFPNTDDPRRFYRLSRAVLVPSLWRESFGRVAAEALANGLPVLASDRGALPETLGDSGFIFALPDRCVPERLVVPTAREVAPWVATIERLDDPSYAADQRKRALREAARWSDERITDQHLAFFEDLLRRRMPT